MHETKGDHSDIVTITLGYCASLFTVRDRRQRLEND